MKNYIADGEVYPHTVAGAAVKSGDVVVIGDTIAIAKTDGAIGELIATQARGVVRLPKLDTSDIAQGKKVYWDATAGRINLTTSGTVYAGKAYEAARAGATFVNVDINA